MAAKVTALVAVLLAGSATGSAAQQRSASWAARYGAVSFRAVSSRRVDAFLHALAPDPSRREMTPAGPPELRPVRPSELTLSLTPVLASAVLPGTGHWLQGRRSAALLFMATEVVGWWIHADARSAGIRARQDYRALVRDVAWSGRGGELPTAFDYFERLATWARSGAFDRDPVSPGLQPELDPSTWNGAQWQLAANLHLRGDVAAAPSTPGYEAAIARYRERAYAADQLWDWSAAYGAQARFRDLIDQSDAGFRRARLALGMVIANHLLSPVEVYLRQRLGVSSLHLEFVPEPSVALHRARFALEFPTSR